MNPFCKQCRSRTCGHVTRRQRRAPKSDELFAPGRIPAPPKVVWFARGGGAKFGPFDDQIAATNFLRLAIDPQRFPTDAFVWPEHVS